MNEIRSLRNDLIGVGLYTVPEASRLVQISEPRIRRWISGYTYGAHGANRSKPALWDSQVGRIDHTLTIGFLDLMEIRFVDRFVHYGVSLQTIRKALHHAQELIGKPYPFSTRRFHTDGRAIFAEVAHDSGETHLLDLVKSQFAFTSMISPSLYRNLDYSDDDDVLRWWPMGHKRQIVVDPAIAFGQPAIREVSIPTATLAAAAKAEGSIASVANWFGVSRSAVRNAVEFEERMAA